MLRHKRQAAFELMDWVKRPDEYEIAPQSNTA
jgi:hypothetical protein